MRIKRTEPPRRFRVGLKEQIEILDCAKITLAPHEQVTFVMPSGKEHDFGARSWGYYATPSINDRLKKQGFKTALVKNALGKYFVFIVDVEKMDEFQQYLVEEKHELAEWLDER